MRIERDKSVLLLVDMQETLVPLIAGHELLTEKCEWLIKLANDLKIPVCATEHYTHGLGKTIPKLQIQLTTPILVDKVTFSCYQDPVFRSEWGKLGKPQVILIGIESHVCIMQTAFDMLEAGNEVFVVSNAIGSRNDFDKKYALKRMLAAGIHLVTAEMIFFEWIGQAGTTEFKTLSKKFLQGENIHAAK